MGQAENRVQHACLQILLSAGCFCWRANTGAVKLGTRFIAFGVAGQPDVQGIIAKGPHRGRFIGVECKAPAQDFPGAKKRRKGRQSPDQIDWQRQCEKAGGLYVLADNSLTLQEALRTLGAM